MTEICWIMRQSQLSSYLSIRGNTKHSGSFQRGEDSLLSTQHLRPGLRQRHVAFFTREVPHIIFFFNLAIVWVLLWIEARRYRFYDAFRARVRMLEAHFLVPMVMENRQMLQGEWKKLVCEDLILPCFKISKLEAVGRRLKRNYVFIFVLILVAWLTKIFLHATAPINDIVSFYHALRIGHIPSWLVALVFAGTFVSVIAITIYVSKRSSGEISEFGTHRSLWRI